MGEREFLISPALGSVTMTAAGFTQPPDSKFVTAKKSFDWMTDDQFNNLQILAIHYEWFQVQYLFMLSETQLRIDGCTVNLEIRINHRIASPLWNFYCSWLRIHKFSLVKTYLLERKSKI